MINDKRKALGRGLDALLPASQGVSLATVAMRAKSSGSGAGPAEIPVDQIDRAFYQPRGEMDQQALKELASSIRRTGVIQPVLLRPGNAERYELIAGERRWLAARLAGKTTVPAIVHDVSNEQAMQMTIVENLQREDLNPMEQARAFDRLGREFALTQEQIAERTGKERPTVANFLRLLRLPRVVQEHVEQGRLSFGHAKVLLTFDHAEEMEKTAQVVLTKALSVRQTEALVYRMKAPEKKVATARQVDPNVRAAEEDLERRLGTQVEIRDHKGKGKIIIRYASLEEFDRVLEALGAGGA